MIPKGSKYVAAVCVFLFGASFGASAAPFLQHAIEGDATLTADARIEKVVVFGRNSRRTVEEFASEQKLNPVELHHKFAASGLIECGAAHGAGQLTLTDDLVTTAAHVFFDEDGAPRAKTCTFVNQVDGKDVRTPIDLSSIIAGSRNPYAVAAVHDWAVARLTRPVNGATPYGLAGAESPNTPVEFVARGHIDWGEGRELSMEKCALHDQLSVGEEGTREFSFDCETGDGASGGAVIVGDKGDPLVGAVLVGWRSNKPFHSAPFSPTHYNFAVTIEGAFKKAVIASAAKAYVAR
ncbi:trypsin-like serine protease [Methylocella tundrae]|uniref:Serine protease n=1 Tax=Methylocella tundrae TaxID=227605 RepID=A0A4U8Z384_METTU|nr:trypsin-like serine protease [Methylocella tundrae]WPP03696.1 trypsin-like peptidase domain-containing protein [Methylocella tundrae]VFU09837.1 Serine protease [Methylocella tundrae]